MSFSFINFEKPLYNSSGVYTSEMLQENSENHGNAFFYIKLRHIFGTESLGN